MILEFIPILGTFGLSGVAFATLAAGALGAGASVYGASQQRVANNKATDANQKAQADQNASAWSAYLMSRGVNPAGATTGQIPQNAQAVNARLPLWANVRRSPTAQLGAGGIAGAAPISFLRKKPPV